MKRSFFQLLIVAGLGMNVAQAETFQANSAKHPVALIELFTSQGCSSCPPAEKWLGELEQKGLGSDTVVPVALHVDYWDYIGWKDRFAQKSFKERQYKYKSLDHSSSVYTPQIMLNGTDIRRVSLNARLSDLKKKIAPVRFRATATERGNSMLDISLAFNRIEAQAENSRVIVVLAESELVHAISSGENAGRKLKHQHVVRSWKNLGTVSNQLSTQLMLDQSWNKAHLKLLVIVETKDMHTQQVLSLAVN